MANTAVYKLERVLDNPLYEGFATVRNESVRGKSRLEWDFLPDDIGSAGRSWSVTRMKTIWTPLPVHGRVNTTNDYPCVNLLIPAFSKRAVEALQDMLLPNGELLPLVTRCGEYCAFNTTTVEDILDHERSQIRWMDERHVVAFAINRFEFIETKLSGLSIFRIVELPTSVFVTNVFVDRVQERGLGGFHFLKVWPLPKGSNWRQPRT